MTERQFQWLLSNRRRAAPAPLLAGAAELGLLRRAGRAARQRPLIERTWALAAPPEWGDRAVPVALQDGVLQVEVADADMAQRLRREAPRLVQLLSTMLPGLRQMRPVPRSDGSRPRPPG